LGRPPTTSFPEELPSPGTLAPVPAPNVARSHVFVSGDVQGVFFRYETRERARAHGLGGWVRNLPDGRVEAVFEGPARAVQAIVDWCRQGPSGARVTEVEVADEESEGLDTFEVRRTP
jgi:acylphosphatase